MDITINETQLSDLFFNHDNLAMIDAYAGNEPPSEEEVQEALKKDAEKFSELLGGQVTPEWLVEDFNKRR